MGDRSPGTTKRYRDVAVGGFEQAIAACASRQLLRAARGNESAHRLDHRLTVSGVPHAGMRVWPATLSTGALLVGRHAHAGIGWARAREGRTAPGCRCLYP